MGVLEEGEEAVLVDFEEAFFAEEVAEAGDEGAVLLGGGEGAFDFNAIAWGELFFKVAFGAFFDGVKGFGDGGLHEFHEEVQEADVPRFVYALDEGSVGIGAGFVSFKGLFADELEGFVYDGFAVGFAT
jgi:hypothetical protein